jgi:RNA polymerase sigma-70 factor, ECF subfamily
MAIACVVKHTMLCSFEELDVGRRSPSSACQRQRSAFQARGFGGVWGTRFGARTPRPETRLARARHVRVSCHQSRSHSRVDPVMQRESEVELNALMSRYASGDNDAFRALHALLDPRLRRFLLRLTGHRARADELAQEAFLRIHKGRSAFACGGPALPWVYAVARNVFLDDARKRKVHAAVVHDDEAVHGLADAPSRQADQVLESRQTLMCVQTALAAMPLAQREAFVLLRFELFSVSEAAEILGTTEASVKSRAFRAYTAIRFALSAQSTAGTEPASGL